MSIIQQKKPYSFSKLSTYQQCPKKYYYSYISDIPKIQVNMTPLLKGRAVHSILEKYPEKSNHKLAPDYQGVANKFINSDLGQKYLLLDSKREYKFGLSRDLTPCSYNDKTALFRGIVDHVCFLDILNLVDWKTGKHKEERWQSFDQLLFYAIYFFKMYSKINQIKLNYVYVEHNIENTIELHRKYLNNYETQLLEIIKNVEDSVQNSIFTKNESKLCEWCDFQEHCKKSKS